MLGTIELRHIPVHIFFFDPVVLTSYFSQLLSCNSRLDSIMTGSQKKCDGYGLDKQLVALKLQLHEIAFT